MIVERKIKLITEQHNIDKPAIQEGFPMKEWTIELYILDDKGTERAAKCFQKVVYNLHPSFENPIQTYNQPPFKCTNEGWGEFEMTVDMFTTEKGGKQTIAHDLNFAKPTYENVHTIQFKNPSQALQSILRETGPLPSDEDRKARKSEGGAAVGSSKKKGRQYDIEKLADAIQALSEDDLLHVIQLVHDYKNEDTYITHNMDAGEFSVDLYTISETLTKLLWEFVQNNTNQAHRLR